MTIMTTTPFGQRPMTAALMKRAMEARQPVAVDQIDKWSLFRDLCAARATWGLSDRTLTVLNALLSFHRPKALDADASLIVYPSNRALSDRTHGMAESTLRRHLAALVHAGLIQRHDSPNGKRYAARSGGCVLHAFGFDLRPLLVRAGDITRAAQAAQEAAATLKRLKAEVTLLKRDAIKLATYGVDSRHPGDWDSIMARLMDAHRATRRVPTPDSLRALRDRLRQLLQDIRVLLKTEDMSGSDACSERHYQNSKEDSSDLEPCLEKQKGAADIASDPPQDPKLPLGLVAKACPDILPYAEDRLRGWHDLVRAAGTVRGMMGISPDAWHQAQRHMGPAGAAITVAAMLQRVDQITAPGGYLRALTAKAEAGAFSPAPMVMALLRAS